jgi:5'-phosphate synthase pdxT subunit
VRSDTARIGVLGLQGGLPEHEAALAALGAVATRVRSERDLAGIDGLLIPGGESTTISLLAARQELFEPVREGIASGLPVFGSCAGMIMLADKVLDGREDRPAFGGIDIAVRRNAFGRQIDSFEAPLDIPQIGVDPFPSVFIRAPWVERVGGQVEVIARLARQEDGNTAGRIVAVRQNRLLATSFHPELTGDRRIHEYFLRIVRGEV